MAVILNSYQNRFELDFYGLRSCWGQLASRYVLLSCHHQSLLRLHMMFTSRISENSCLLGDLNSGPGILRLARYPYSKGLHFAILQFLTIFFKGFYFSPFVKRLAKKLKVLQYFSTLIHNSFTVKNELKFFF